MKFAILGFGIIGALLFFFSVYSLFTSGKHFKMIAYGFLVTAVTVFILVIIRNLKEQFDIGNKK